MHAPHHPAGYLKQALKALEAHSRSLSLTLTHSRSLSLSLSLLLSSSHSRTRTLFLVLTVLSFSLLRQLDQLNVFFVSAARSVESDNTVVVSYAVAFHCTARMLCYAICICRCTCRCFMTRTYAERRTSHRRWTLSGDRTAAQPQPQPRFHSSSSRKWVG